MTTDGKIPVDREYLSKGLMKNLIILIVRYLNIDSILYIKNQQQKSILSNSNIPQHKIVLKS